MQVIKDYRKYQEHSGEYQEWKSSLEQTDIKRSKYIKENNLKLSREDTARAKVLLNAIDTMDEFSQSNAEEMETATETIQGAAAGLASLGGLFLGTQLYKSKTVMDWIEKLAAKHPKLGLGTMQLIPLAVSIPISIAAALPLISWAAKKQVGASRKGRMLAMNKELQNPALFAVLTPEQEKEAKKAAETIPVDKDMKKAVKAKMGKGSRTGGTLRQAWSLLTDDNKYLAQKRVFDEKIKQHEKRFDEPLSQEDILRAKKDQQLLARVVEKMDYASQEYAEKTELATNTLHAAAFLGGGINGWISHKITSHFKTNNNWVKYGIPGAAWLGTTLALSMLAAKIQKQASRVGRYQVKKELMKNPEQLMYIDEKKLPEGKVKVPEKKKENFFSFIGRIIRENREYNQHIKKTGIKELQYQKAAVKTKLSDEQLKDAKTLQMNIFKTFNKVDDKSQQYAESVEAAGEMYKLPVRLLEPILGLGLGWLFGGRQMIGAIEKYVKEYDLKKAAAQAAGKAAPSFNIAELGGVIKAAAKFTLPSILLSFAAEIGLDALFTKKQIEASRTADMLALKELSDYRHYADYDNRHSDKKKTAPAASSEAARKVEKPTNLLASFLK